jgi:hypothetical protein
MKAFHAANLNTLTRVQRFLDQNAADQKRAATRSEGADEDKQGRRCRRPRR